MTVDQLSRVSERIADDVARAAVAQPGDAEYDWWKVLFALYPNSPPTHAKRERDYRAMRAEMIRLLGPDLADGELRPCVLCGVPSSVLWAKSLLPMFDTVRAVNTLPPGVEGWPVCRACRIAMWALPYGAWLTAGSATVLTCDSPEIERAFVRANVARAARIQHAGFTSLSAGVGPEAVVVAALREHAGAGARLGEDPSRESRNDLATAATLWIFQERQSGALAAGEQHPRRREPAPAAHGGRSGYAGGLEAAAGMARPYEHQIKAGGHVGHLIVRAPTGTGKTEAGLAWASRQLDDMPGRPRLIWQLPYRASIDAARFRFIENLRAEPDEIAILHATAAQSLLAECVGDDGQAGREQARKAKAQRAAMRLYAQRIRVATPHQLLRAALAGPQYSAGLIEQANALMVLDELHAYDPVVFGRICAAMRLWARLGSRVCVLSATLAQPMIDLVRESLGSSPVEIVDAPPGVAPDRHRLVVDEEPIDSAASLARIRGWLAEGHSVLVVANTVARAQDLYRALRPAALAAHPGDEDAAILLHSRFRHEDRDAIEGRIRGRYPERGEGEGERRGGLVVATQALEVSLCLDFDRGVSELAPVEAIAQRAGRVNRRGRHPDGVVEFRVHLAVEAWPYEQAALDAARLALAEHPGPMISEQTVDAWLKTAYATEWGREWEARARQSRDAFDAAFLTFTTPFHDRAEFADKLARELDSVEVLHHEDVARYRDLEAEDPLLAHRLLIPMRYGPAVRHGNYNRRLRLFEIALPYSPETGLSLPVKGAKAATPPTETIL